MKVNPDEVVATANGIIVRVLDCIDDDVTPVAVLDDPPLNVSRFERAEISASLEKEFDLDCMLADDEWRTIGDLHHDLLGALGVAE